MKFTLQKNTRIEPLTHFFIWCLVVLYPYIKHFGSIENYSMSFVHELVALLFNMIAVYAAYFWFFPRKNKKRFFALLLLFFIGNAMMYNYVDGFFHPGDQHPEILKLILINVVRYISLSTAFFALFSIKQLYRKQQEIDSITTKKQEAELRVLKGQINPHFLFNTLNTIYASALEKDGKTPDLILKLSDNFRYVLTEGQKSSVPIKKELRHLKDYIKLQEERLSEKIIVDWTEEIDDYEQKIPPLLLISLVENAFKYCSMLTGRGHLILLKITLDMGEFTFYIENPFNKNAKKEIDYDWEESGIGIENTRKRLQLLYPNRHKMEITEKDAMFKVLLKIQL